MRTAMHAFSAMLVIAGMAGCAATPTPDALREQGHEPLTTSELRALFAGGATQNWNSGQRSGTTEYMPDGSAKLTTGSFETDGSWRIADGKLCTQYEEIRGGEESCLTVFRVDDGYRIFDGDEMASRATFE